MQQEIVLKNIDVSQLIELQKISRITFVETYEAFNTPENMNSYLTIDLGLNQLKSEICNIDSTFYFAFFGDRIIGYLKVNRGKAQTVGQTDDSLEIERIYVLKEFHRKGVGQILYEKAKAIASEINSKYIWLGVWERNQRAIEFYKKNGFVEFDKHIFMLGEDKQIDLVMRYNLRQQ